jgi:hypothetical protein
MPPRLRCPTASRGQVKREPGQGSMKISGCLGCPRNGKQAWTYQGNPPGFLKEPLNKSLAGATVALRDEMRERRRREWLFPFARSLTKQTARKAPSHAGCGKIGAHCVTLLGIVDQATTCVVRLVIIPILPATRSARICSEVP